MKNLTISLDERLLKEGREYSRKHNISLNRLLRNTLVKTFSPKTSQWLDEAFITMDSTKARLKGRKWKREDVYDV
ncbi:MAG: hypothetical protein WAX69_08110 [Victivallales bacterium]